MYYDEMLETVVNADIISSMRFEQSKKQLREAEAKNNNYEKYTLNFNNVGKDGKYYKHIVIENYGTGQLGSRIINAVTGQKYPYMVGSKDEDLLFKIADASGRNCRNSTLMLYYDTPEQYENHHFTTVSQAIKEKWYEKNLEARRRSDQ